MNWIETYILVQVFAQNKQGAPNLSSVQWIKAGVVFAFLPPDIKPAGEVTMLFTNFVTSGHKPEPLPTFSCKY